MKKGKKFKARLSRIITVIIVMFFCMFTLTACLGGDYSGGSGSSGGNTGGNTGGSTGGNTGGNTGDNNKDDDFGDYVDDFDDVLLGAIGVYDCDSNDTEIFYDNYQKGFVSFNTLIDRQFLALANVLCAGLYKAYDSTLFSCTITGFGSNKTVEDKVVSQGNIHNDDATKFYYEQAWNGGYLIDTATYEYDTDKNGSYLWKKFSGGGPVASEMANDLRAIYLNTKSISNSASAGKFGFTDNSLMDTYKNFTGGVTDNSQIDTIGFTQDYMFNVLYYLAYSVVGETAFDASNTAKDSGKINLTGTNSITADNYISIQNYKGYEVVLPEIVSNAFKLVITGDKNISVSQSPIEYCWNTLGNTTIGTTTLFPIMQRKEYIFFKSIKDISDAEVIEDVNWDKFSEEYNKMTDEQKKEWDNARENKTVNPGTARKLEKIILIPEIDKNKYKKSSFAVSGLYCSFASSSGEYEIQIMTSAVNYDGTKKFENEALVFEDGSYDEEDSGNTSGGSSDNMVTKSNHLIIQSEPKPNKYDAIGFVFGDEDESDKYQFTSIENDKKEIITSAFNNGTSDGGYNVAGTNERIDIDRLSVWNKFIKSSIVEENGVTSLAFNINSNVLDKNFFTFTFKYFDRNGKDATETKIMYVLDFEIL